AFATSENEPSGFSPKWSFRIVAAFSLSEPGSAKRFVSRSDRPEEALPAARTATSQTISTAQRNRIIVRAQRAIDSFHRAVASRLAVARLVTTIPAVKRVPLA